MIKLKNKTKFLYFSLHEKNQRIKIAKPKRQITKKQDGASNRIRTDDIQNHNLAL